MKLFENILDKKIEKLGFSKEEDNEYGVRYRRYNNEFHYTQIVYIGHKRSGEHILQSYDLDLMDSKCIGNICVGLTYDEMKIFTKKFKYLTKRWKNDN